MKLLILAFVLASSWLLALAAALIRRERRDILITLLSLAQVLALAAFLAFYLLLGEAGPGEPPLGPLDFAYAYLSLAVFVLLSLAFLRRARGVFLRIALYADYGLALALSVVGFLGLLGMEGRGTLDGLALNRCLTPALLLLALIFHGARILRRKTAAAPDPGAEGRSEVPGSDPQAER